MKSKSELNAQQPYALSLLCYKVIFKSIQKTLFKFIAYYLFYYYYYYCCCCCCYCYYYYCYCCCCFCCCCFCCSYYYYYYYYITLLFLRMNRPQKQVYVKDFIYIFSSSYYIKEFKIGVEPRSPLLRKTYLFCCRAGYFGLWLGCHRVGVCTWYCTCWPRWCPEQCL